MKRSGLFFLIALIIVLSACRAAPAEPPPVNPTAVAAPTEAVVTPPEEPATTFAPIESAATAPAAPPALFEFGMDDRGVYAAGLTAAAREALDGLPGAPVYHMEITIDDSMTLVSGRQIVAFTNMEDVTLEEVYFHLHPATLDGALDVSDVTVDGAPAEANEKGTVIAVPLPSPLAPGGTATIAMRFETRVPTDIGRNYGVLAYYEDILALAHFYPMLSVYNDEGWNVAEPDVQGDLTFSDAAFYLVRVTAPADTVLVGSGVVIAKEADGETQTVTYALGPARDFYLAAGDFAVVSQTVSETTINSYAPARLADGAAAALDVAAAAVKSQGERLGAYPYTELDIVTTPTSALGIEYPGLIVGTLRMYDVQGETESGIPWSAILESTTAHEVSHQWFYNLIGNDQLDQPWLDESLASYATYRYYLDRYGQAAADSYFETFTGRWARVEDATIPVGLPVAAYEGPEYSAIVYGRGTIFVRELEELMGREAFDAFLRDYAARFRWSIADTEEFRALAEEQCGCDLGSLFTEWVYE